MLLHTDLFSTLPVSEANLPELLALYRQCEDFLALGPNPHASEEMVRQDLVLSQPHGGSYTGIYTGQPPVLAGVLDIVPCGHQGDPEAAYIELLMLGGPFRGQGLGARVVAALEQELRQAGIQTIYAGVQANNPLAIRFWQRHGFHIVGPSETLTDGTVCYPLEKRLIE